MSSEQRRRRENRREIEEEVTRKASDEYREEQERHLEEQERQLVRWFGKDGRAAKVFLREALEVVERLFGPVEVKELENAIYDGKEWVLAALERFAAPEFTSRRLYLAEVWWEVKAGIRPPKKPKPSERIEAVVNRVFGDADQPRQRGKPN